MPLGWTVEGENKMGISAMIARGVGDAGENRAVEASGKAVRGESGESVKRIEREQKRRREEENGVS